MLQLDISGEFLNKKNQFFLTKLAKIHLYLFFFRFHSMGLLIGKLLNKKKNLAFF
jgi:hypothetical protein